MKKIQLQIITVFLGSAAMAQTQWDVLDINNIEARINFKNTLFTDLDNSGAGFVVDDSGNTTIYAAGLWIAGKDINGQIKSAAQLYNGCDFRSTCSVQGVYKLNKSEVDEFISWYDCVNNPACNDAQNFPGYIIPNTIVNWPAHGNINCDEPFYLAPFYDHNNDGIYDPADGDYPQIKGDQSIWWCMRDDTLHCNGGDPLGIELRCMAYAYNCVNSEAINNTIFVEYEVRNIGTQTLYDTYVGNWADMDIGYGEHIGCSVENGIFYTHSAGSANPNPFQNGWPVTGAMLFGPKQDNDGQDNPGPTVLNPNYLTYSFASSQGGISYPGLGLNYGNGIVDDEQMMMRTFSHYSQGNDPNNTAQAYNILSGKQASGANKYYIINGDTLVTKYDLYDDSDPKGWATMGQDSTFHPSEGYFLNPGGDRRGVGSVGPVTMTPGESYTTTFAYTNAFDPTQNGNLAAKNKLMSYAQDIRTFMENCQCCSSVTAINEMEERPFSLSVYPNPGKGQFMVESDAFIESVSLYNISGKLVHKKEINTFAKLITVPPLASGIYLLSVQTDKGTESMKIKIE